MKKLLLILIFALSGSGAWAQLGDHTFFTLQNRIHIQAGQNWDSILKANDELLVADVMPWLEFWLTHFFVPHHASYLWNPVNSVDVVYDNYINLLNKSSPRTLRAYVSGTWLLPNSPAGLATVYLAVTQQYPPQQRKQAYTLLFMEDDEFADVLVKHEAEALRLLSQLKPSAARVMLSKADSDAWKKKLEPLRAAYIADINKPKRAPLVVSGASRN